MKLIFYLFLLVFSLGIATAINESSNSTTSPSPESVIVCNDDDNGTNIFVAAGAWQTQVLIDADHFIGGAGTLDYCDFSGNTNGVLMEAVCEGNNPIHVQTDCPSEAPYCNKAVCSANKPSCTDTDNYIDPYVKGTMTESRYPDGPEYTDYCQNMNTKQPWNGCKGELCSVREYYCTDPYWYTTYQDILCPDGCQDGACLGKAAYPTPAETQTTTEEVTTSEGTEITTAETTSTETIDNTQCVLLKYYYMKTCPYSQKQNPVIDQLETEKTCSKVERFVLTWDDLAVAKYGITGTPTMVAVNENGCIKQKSGYTDHEALKSFIQSGIWDCNGSVPTITPTTKETETPEIEIPVEEINSEVSGTLYYFYNENCPFCQKQEPVIDEIEQNFPNVKVEHVHMDVEGTFPNFKITGLAEKYNVHGTPTFVFIESDGCARKNTGYTKYEGMKNWLLSDQCLKENEIAEAEYNGVAWGIGQPPDGVQIKESEPEYPVCNSYKKLKLDLSGGSKRIAHILSDEKYAVLDVYDDELQDGGVYLYDLTDDSWEKISKHFRAWNAKIAEPYVVWEEQGTDTIVIYNINTKEYSKITNASAPDVYGGRIAYLFNNGLYIYDITTGSKKQIASGSSFGFPIITSEYVVINDHTEKDTIFTENIKTGKEFRIKDAEGNLWVERAVGDKILIWKNVIGEDNPSFILYDLSASSEKVLKVCESVEGCQAAKGFVDMSFDGDKATVVPSEYLGIKYDKGFLFEIYNLPSFEKTAEYVLPIPYASSELYKGNLLIIENGSAKDGGIAAYIVDIASCNGPSNSPDDKTEEETKEEPESKEIVCPSGCTLNGACIIPTVRQNVAGVDSYCDITNEWLPQKAETAVCQNNFECKTNFCSNNACYDITKEVKETKGLLEKIIDWLKSMFSWFNI